MNFSSHMHAHRHESSHTTSGLQPGLPQASPSSCDWQKETAILWKASLNLYCIYWSACCILLFICPCGWSSVCALCEDVKLSLRRRYFWRHLFSQLKPVCGEITRVNGGVLHRDAVMLLIRWCSKDMFFRLSGASVLERFAHFPVGTI